MSIVSTHLIVNGGIPDIVHHCGHGLNIIFAFFVVLGVDAITERVPMVPDQPESTMRELARLWVRVEWDYLLEQLFLTLVVIYIPGSIVVVLL